MMLDRQMQRHNDKYGIADQAAVFNKLASRNQCYALTSRPWDATDLLNNFFKVKEEFLYSTK